MTAHFNRPSTFGDADRIERLRRTLAWITAELDALGVPFQVAGGLAARAHGASRPLHDIDFYVPDGAPDPVPARR